jgi:GDP-L-fucose synthase
MEKTDKIYIAGHNGMVGSAILRKLKIEGYNNILTKNSNHLDLRNQQMVDDFFKKEKPKYVILAAAKVGGIHANNTYRAEFIYNNLMIEANVIHASYLNNVTKLLFLGSSCIYPKMAPQPLKEDYLLSGYLESTNKPYAVAKIAGIELCDSYRAQYGCNFISAMPTNLYGINDNYHSENSHVLPALIKRIISAKSSCENSVEIWGTGNPRREFMHVDDLADASLFLLRNYDMAGPINIGSGEEISIKELALLISIKTSYKGELYFNQEKPDGTPRKFMDSSKINALGWKAKIKLNDGIEDSINDYIERYEKGR